MDAAAHPTKPSTPPYGSPGKTASASVNRVARGAFDGRADVKDAVECTLAALELPQYAGGFVANGVDFLAIPALERDDWVELGVPIGHRARIVKEHKALHPEMW